MKRVFTILLFFAMSFGFQVQAQWMPKGAALNGTLQFEHFGSALSLSDAGDVMAIGAPGDSQFATSGGSCKAFRFSGGQWVQISIPITGEAVGDRFGFSISLNSDGNIMAVGAPSTENDKIHKGYVKVFRLISGQWVQYGLTIRSNEGGNLFGYSVSLSADGQTLAIGAPYDDNGGSKPDGGSVSVYRISNNIWTLLGSPIHSISSNDRFGTSVSISRNGNIVAAGAPWSDIHGVNSGQVRIFQYSSTNWTEMGSPISGQNSEDWWGWSVDLSGDGFVVAAGAFKNDAAGAESGQSSVYRWTNNSWKRIGQAINGEGPGNSSGYSVSLNQDGNILAVGAPLAAGSGLHEGNTRIFKNRNGVWTQIGNSINGANAGDWFGSAVALNAGGNIVAVGATQNNTSATKAGQVRAFEHPTLLSVSGLNKDNLHIYPNPASRYLNVKWGHHIPYRLTIVDLTGRVIRKWNSGEIEHRNHILIEGLPKGTYCAVVAYKNAITKKLFVIE